MSKRAISDVSAIYNLDDAISKCKLTGRILQLACCMRPYQIVSCPLTSYHRYQTECLGLHDCIKHLPLPLSYPFLGERREHGTV